MKPEYKYFLRFALIFAVVFCVCYYGMLLINGLAIPGGSYSKFVAEYFNVTSWLRKSLMFGVKAFVSLTSMQTTADSEFVLRKTGASGIVLIYSCLGIGVSSVWTAYVIAYGGKIKKVLLWLFGGLLLLWIINVLRLSMVLLAVNSQFSFPFGIDHHTWFNMIAYAIILGLMYLRSKTVSHGDAANPPRHNDRKTNTMSGAGSPAPANEIA